MSGPRADEENENFHYHSQQLVEIIDMKPPKDRLQALIKTVCGREFIKYMPAKVVSILPAEDQLLFLDTVEQYILPSHLEDTAEELFVANRIAFLTQHKKNITTTNLAQLAKIV